MRTPITITVLVENSVSRRGLLAEHGLAFWIDLGSKHLLFDTGQSAILVANARQLGIDPDTVDVVALSHGHYDHSGGLAEALKRAAGPVMVYAGQNALRPKYRCENGVVREIGIPAHCLKALESRDSAVKTVVEPTEVCPGVFITGEIPRRHPEEQQDELFYLDMQGHKLDKLMDDQALYLRTSAGIVVVFGCAHAGVINTLDYIRHLTDDQPFHAVLGGMHLRSASSERIKWTIEALGHLGIDRLYPGHCTGHEAEAALWTAFPGRCFPCEVGSTLEI